LRQAIARRSCLATSPLSPLVAGCPTIGPDGDRPWLALTTSSARHPETRRCGSGDRVLRWTDGALGEALPIEAPGAVVASVDVAGPAVEEAIA